MSHDLSSAFCGARRLATAAALVALLAGACGDGGGGPDAVTDAGVDSVVPSDVAGPDLPVLPDAATPDVPGDAGGVDALPDAAADAVDPPPSGPAGIYFNAFSGGFSGSEWFEVVALGEPGRYSMTDIFGGGFTGTIDAGGAITLDSGVGTGEVTGPDALVLRPRIGGTEFTFDCTRAPFTTAGFVLRARPPVTPAPELAGTFRNRLSFHDVVTGAEQQAGDEQIEVTLVEGNLRITDPAGLYFQGPFVAPQVAVFRAVQGASGGFASFPGSEANVNSDLLGEVVYDGSDAFVGIFLLQTRAPLGQQQQTLIRFEATRE